MPNALRELQTATAMRAVARETLEDLHTLLSLGPAQLDASPTRLLFLTSDAARARLTPHLAAADMAKALTAPACAVIGYDAGFAEQLAEFLRHPSAGRPDTSQALQRIAQRDRALQGEYLAVAARSLDLEVVRLGFDPAGVSSAFFQTPRLQAIFVGAIGHLPTPEPRSRRHPV